MGKGAAQSAQAWLRLRRAHHRPGARGHGARDFLTRRDLGRAHLCPPYDSV